MFIDYRYISLPRQPNLEPLCTTLGRNVRRLRIDQGLSISTLAFICNMSREQLAKIEQGRADSRLSYVERLADALCVEPLVLLVSHSCRQD